jgi:hypothetical protein
MHTSVNDLIRSLQQFPGDTPVIGVTLKGVASNVISVQCCAGIDPEKPNNCFICFGMKSIKVHILDTWNQHARHRCPRHCVTR